MKIKNLILLFLSFSIVSCHRYPYTSFSAHPTKRQIRKAMKYSTSEYKMPTTGPSNSVNRK